MVLSGSVSRVNTPERKKNELSVVADEIYLDVPGDKVLLQSMSRYANHFTPVGFSPAVQTRKSGQRHAARVSVMDDPDEMYMLTRRDQLADKKSWIPGVLCIVVLLVRLISPWWRLTHCHDSSRPLLAPGPSLYYMLIPLMLSNLIVALVALSPILRGTDILTFAVGPCLPIAVLADTAWLWLMGMNSGDLEVAGCMSIISLAASMAGAVSVDIQRKESLNGVWQQKQRYLIKMRDYWFVEIPCTIQLCWSFIEAIISLNFVATFSEYFFTMSLPMIPLAESLENNSPTPLPYGTETAAYYQEAVSLITLILIAACGAAITTGKKGWNGVTAFCCTWLCWDLSYNLLWSPDVKRFPHLQWIIPDMATFPMSSALRILAVFFSLVAFGVVCLQSTRALSHWRSFTGRIDAISFLGAKSVKSYTWNSSSKNHLHER